VKELPRGLSPGPTCVPEARALSARLARLSLPYLSSDRAKSRRSPSTSVESFLTVRALGFPREFGFGVRRRGVVVSGLGTVRISVGTPTFPVLSYASGHFSTILPPSRRRHPPGSAAPEGGSRCPSPGGSHALPQRDHAVRTGRGHFNVLGRRSYASLTGRGLVVEAAATWTSFRNSHT